MPVIDVTSPDAVVQLTCDLIRIDSTNPTSNEEQASRYVQGFLRDQGLPFEVQEVAPGRPNVVARLPGGGGPSYVMLGHLDTVPVGAGWQHDPFGGEVVGDVVWGRGACDMKGGLAAQLVAFTRLARLGARLSGDLVLCAVIDEETFQIGAQDLVKRGVITGRDYIMAAEPSDNSLFLAHKGVMWYEVIVRGKAAHAGNPGQGCDANQAMARAMVAMDRMCRELPDRHPLLTPTTLVVGRVEGGMKTNIVAEQARAEVDFRLLPPATPAQGKQRLERAVAAAVAEVPGTSFEVNALNHRPPVECLPDSPLIRAFDQAYKQVTGDDLKHGGFSAYTDASMASVLTGSRHCVVFGPGALADAHSNHEQVRVAELRQAVDVLHQAALELLG